MSSPATGMETENPNDKIEIVESALPMGGEVDVQISTAKRYPRSIQAFKQQALAMATFDEQTAAGCFYSLPRGGKPIEGPSARLAEIVLNAWGNIRCDAKVVGIEGGMVVAEAMTWDLEKNVAVRVQVRRRITDKNGNRFSDDMVVVTGNAATAIALRNSVFKVVPNVFTQSIYQAARQAAIGNIKTIAAARADMVEYFGKMGITPDRIYAAIGKAGIEEIGLDELATLKGVATALKDNEFPVDEAFPPLTPTTNGGAGTSGLKERLNKTGNGDAAAEGATTAAATEATTPPATETPTPPAPIAKPTNKTEYLAAIAAIEKDDPERVATVLDGRELGTLKADAVKDVYEALTQQTVAAAQE
jgi:hypothetical protein